MKQTRYKSLITMVLAFLAVGGLEKAFAFDVETHGFITRKAMNASILKTDKLLNTFGLWNGKMPQPPLLEKDCAPVKSITDLDKIYFDGPRPLNGPDSLRCRSLSLRKTPKQDRHLSRILLPWESIIDDWVIAGSMREDDNPNEVDPRLLDEELFQTPSHSGLSFKLFCPQKVELLNCIEIRVLNHFFDPFNNIPLSFDLPRNVEMVKDLPITVGSAGMIQLGLRNPEWAFGSEQLSPRLQIEGLLSRVYPNHFTIPDLHEALFRGITGHRLEDGKLVSIAPTQRQRNRWLATAFRSLGDLLHLNQDMGQPQHTRNDPHAGGFGIGHRSVFEYYVNARALNDIRVMEKVATDLPCVMLPLRELDFNSPYKDNIPRFPRYLDYWTTSLGPENLDKVGMGLADYTNRGFFTHGTNLGHSDYPLPPNNKAMYPPSDAVPLTDCPNATKGMVLRGDVKDGWSNEISRDVPLTATSGFITYTLNRVVYDAMADHVIPRAVAYSTGIINHVFRGRLDVISPEEDVFALTDHSDGKGFKFIKARVTNKTEGIKAATGEIEQQHMLGGTLVGVVRFHRNTCYSDNLKGEYSERQDGGENCRKGNWETDDLDQEIVVSKPLAFDLQANASKAVTFDFSETPIPFAATDIYLQIVYLGSLGSEEVAIVVGGKDVSEPTYIGIINSLDYTSVEGVVYSLADLQANKDNVLSKIQRSNSKCVKTLLDGSLQLINSCFEPHPLQGKWIVGASDAPNLEAAILHERRFVRFAVLGDTEFAGFTFKVAKEGGCNKVDFEAIFPVAKNQWGDPLRMKYSKQKMKKSRGAVATYFVHCMHIGDTNPFLNIPTEALGLPDSENYKPVPFTVKF